MFPKLINVVRWELESLALGTDKAAEVGRLVNNYARSWAYAMLHETEDALAAVRPHNLKWATEDALVKASGKVIKLVAAQTGSLVKWITERDERVCSVCEPRDGVVYQADQAPDLPAHPRCRCGLVAVANRMAEAA